MPASCSAASFRTGFAPVCGDSPRSLRGEPGTNLPSGGSPGLLVRGERCRNFSRPGRDASGNVRPLTTGLQPWSQRRQQHRRHSCAPEHYPDWVGVNVTCAEGGTRIRTDRSGHPAPKILSHLNLQFTIDEYSDLWYPCVCYLEQTSLIPPVTPPLTLDFSYACSLLCNSQKVNSFIIN